MIKISNINFSYSKKQNLFNNLSWEVEPGFIYGLLGKNGAGKTTLLKLIVGLLKPNSGSIIVNGYTPFERSPIFLSNIIFIPEEFFVPSMKIHSFIKYFSPFYENFDNEKFYKYLNDFEIDPNNNILVSSLSYGQKKKLLISFAFASQVPLVIMDEPTNGLDIPSKTIFRKLCIDSLTDKKILIISTHQVKDVERLLDKITILDNGKIISNDSVENITATYECAFKEALPETGVLYYEKTLFGYKVISENISGTQSVLDIELYFNAMIKNSKK